MANNVAVSEGMSEYLRTTVLEAFVKMIPAEELDTRIRFEINAFFNEGVEMTIAEIKTSSWGARSDVSVTTVMTPFRQIIWNILHQQIKSALDQAITANAEEFKKGVVDWVMNELKPMAKGTVAEMSPNVGAALGMGMFTRAQIDAVNNSYTMLRDAFEKAGLGQALTAVSLNVPFSSN